MPSEAFIVSTARTPVGRNKGALRQWHPADLAAVAVDDAVRRAGVPADAVDDVIIGCVSQIGAQAANLGRNVVLSSKVLPETIPGCTVDRQCGSSQQALHFAAQGVMSGTQSIVVAGGVEVMSAIPIGSNVMDSLKHEPARGNPFTSKGFTSKYADKLKKVGLTMPSQFVGAELLVKKYKLTRAELDQLAVESHRRAAEATKAGKFAGEIVPIVGHDKEGKEITVTADEGMRSGMTLEALAKLKPMHPIGQLTPATASQISDGASAVVICNAEAVKKYNLKPLARIVSMAVIGCDPVVMLEGPVYATKKVLKQSGLAIGDIGLYEVNEAFASVPLMWCKALNADPSRLNVNGSGMSLGHAIGNTGTRLFTTLLSEMQRRNVRFGLVSICEGGGTANATIIENLQVASQPTKSKL